MKIKANQKDRWEDVTEPGDYFLISHEKSGSKGMKFICPCGCGQESYLSFTDSRKRWERSGFDDCLTLWPSLQMLCDCRWHGYLTNGYFESV